MGRKSRMTYSFTSLSSSSSSYEVDSDEDAEQRMATKVNGGATLSKNKSPQIQTEKHNVIKNDDNDNDHDPNEQTKFGRYSSLLSELDLDGKLRVATNLKEKRTISNNDVFCNREMKFSSLGAIGFDMDYTLAQYKQPAFDKLAFDGAKEKLVNTLGYPEEILSVEYDHKLWVRGLIIDIQKGNFLKIDRHKYVRVAYHGLRPISSLNRKLLYSRTFNKVPSFSEKHFINMDTLFQYVDAHLFANLIEMKDRGDYEFLDGKTYEDMYRDIRECVDLCHRDGVIKDEVARNPEKYIVLDDGLVPMLEKMKAAGVKVFLLTNSHWEYTSVAMNYLYHQKNADPETKLKNEWTDLFDLVIVGSCKPVFLVDPYLNLYRVNSQDGSLRNTDGLYEIEALGENGAQKFLDQGKIFQGGNWMHLQAMLEIKAGEEILYVGDHLYADVLRSKRTLGWRTGLIVPELEEEMNNFEQNKELAQQITELRNLRDELSAEGDKLRLEYSTGKTELTQMLEDLEHDDNVLKAQLSDMADSYHSSFHPMWGQLFYAGYQDSRFAFYVQNYACIYMSKASNLGLISMERSLRTAGEMLPHDKLIADNSSNFSQQ